MLNIKSPKVDPTSVEPFPIRLVSFMLGYTPTKAEMRDAIWSVSNEKVAGPDSLPVASLKLDKILALRQSNHIPSPVLLIGISRLLD